MTKHKLLGIIFPFVLLFTIIVTAIYPSRAFADDVTIEDQYKIWRSYRVVVDCLKSDFTVNDDILETNQATLNAIFDEGKQLASGSMYNDLMGISGDDIDCNTEDSDNAIFKELGYRDARDFADAINKNQFKEGGRIQKSKVEEMLKGVVTEKGSRLGLDQDPAFQFWFANKLYRSSSYGCDGVLNTERNRDTSVEGDFWLVKSDGGTEKFPIANFNKPKDAVIKGVDSYMTSRFNDNDPDCVNIANWLTEARAKSYAQKVQANQDEARNLEAVRNDADSAAAPPSCETKNTGIMDWVLCGIVNAIDNVLVGTDGTGGLLGAIYELLYISPDRYEDDGLRTVWTYFRNLATLALVLIGLIMVIGQAISKE